MIERPIAPGRESLVGRTTIEGKVVHILDALNDPEYTWRDGNCGADIAPCSACL